MNASLADYRALIALDAPFTAPEPAAAEQVPELVGVAIARLLGPEAPSDFGIMRERLAHLPERDALRALLTVRPPRPFLSSELHALLDRLLAFERRQRPTVEALDLPGVLPLGSVAPGFPAPEALALWQGDITTLRVDAIVNAANDALLGCFQPFHRCIDNAIHAAAGPRLREDCARIMELQGESEPTGGAKVTRAYHLPASYVLHTVGPIYRGGESSPGPEDRRALADSYRACLELAAELPQIRSLAFPCISTGVFGFPAPAAAQVAVETVAAWLDAHPGRFDCVVFNVFLDADLALYRECLATPPAR